MGEEDSGNVKWNFDDAESRLIFEMKLEYWRNSKEGNLDGSFWSLLRLLTEAKPLFDEKVKKDLSETMDGIIEKRYEMNNFAEDLDEEQKSEVFLILNKFYEIICDEIVNKNYYFTKKKDYLGL